MKIACFYSAEIFVEEKHRHRARHPNLLNEIQADLFVARLRQVVRRHRYDAQPYGGSRRDESNGVEPLGS